MTSGGIKPPNFRDFSKEQISALQQQMQLNVMVRTSANPSIFTIGFCSETGTAVTIADGSFCMKAVVG